MSGCEPIVRTAAILPVKGFPRAKQRLGRSVSDPLRRDLAEAMVSDVLAALARTPGIDRTIVVTGERTAALAAAALGALVVHDAHERGQSQAALLGIERALAEGAGRVLCVPGDCPALDPAELGRLLGEGPSPANAHGQTPAPELVIIPDRHGTGTNGLLITPPGAVDPSFGPGSCERHRALAAAAGVACRVERPSSLLLDIDTGADLAQLREVLEREAGRPGFEGRATRTRAVLTRPEHRASLSPTGRS